MQRKNLFAIMFVGIMAFIFASVQVYASETDGRIESSARQSYIFKTFLKNDDIQVRSKDGVVTLTGNVAEESNKSLAQETVASLPGVKSVDNKLTVKGKALEKGSDAWLTTKVKLSLLFHRSVKAADTEVVSRSGVVTLRGKADSMAQKDLATEYVKDVDGVESVINEMTVASVASESSSTSMSGKIDAIADAIDDASIVALVKTTLLYHRSTRALHTTVESQNGVVTLGGTSRNAAEKALATKVVGDVPGVVSVNNNMNVEVAK